MHRINLTHKEIIQLLSEKYDISKTETEAIIKMFWGGGQQSIARLSYSNMRILHLKGIGKLSPSTRKGKEIHKLKIKKELIINNIKLLKLSRKEKLTIKSIDITFDEIFKTINKK